MGYSRMLVETGLTFLNSLIKNKMIDDMYIFKSRRRLGQKGKNNSTSRYLKKFHSKLIKVNLKGDYILKKEF